MDFILFVIKKEKKINSVNVYKYIFKLKIKTTCEIAFLRDFKKNEQNLKKKNIS